ncbi:unnamed protein product [Prorocentrum cordatum]|uniref:Uncharacterized protein n=1 Tax=Prorocentrum cordatum TaxID=2364126 RepID=A0ABN9UEW3_9DINO|nr:unnamed protein product [Polarella glacialis]
MPPAAARARRRTPAQRHFASRRPRPAPRRASGEATLARLTAGAGRGRGAEERAAGGARREGGFPQGVGGGRNERRIGLHRNGVEVKRDLPRQAARQRQRRHRDAWHRWSSEIADRSGPAGGSAPHRPDRVKMDAAGPPPSAPATAVRARGGGPWPGGVLHSKRSVCPSVCQ